MKIYFIRHGEAEIYAEDDFKRKLTTIGRVKLENSFKAFANRLEDKRSYKIYSSPLERAKETAEILAKYLDSDFEVKDYLAGGRIRDILKTLDQDENYILVSHEPFISNWIYQLTGEMKIISRGSINFVEIDPKEFTE
ncbi:MAG: histidine phosphatase family protein [Peptoniphilus harei]|uniref:SixA phosphatase family protein n=1 Tax=Peptoniphilus TaxID=162289 RepID=UPI00254E72C7|nr:histidine phosphatase family protein [Peptoniphilus harei]MDK7755582.1 histidine phosphatase family protein [Peptoniphilus harei]MDK7761067.1 histidine phosphatase family protein [Peptoniphilus harei]MDK8270857.1 histidine phosphatase family protein [Peptoniphilus harei]MDK8339435.1 histidine phosphatase family protein [Peptoniphilus harei]